MRGRRSRTRDLERPGPGRNASLATAIGMLVLLVALWFMRGSCSSGTAGVFEDIVRPATPSGTAATAAEGVLRMEPAPATAAPPAPALPPR